MKSNKKITITVSGLSGSGKTYIAKLVAENLGLRYYSVGKFFREIAKKEGMSIEEFCKTRKASVDKKIEKKTMNLVEKGNAVIDGRLTGWVAGDKAFKMYVSCPLKIRAERVAKRDKISEKEAEKRLKERDKSDREKYLKIYGVDILDKNLYDKIIDNSVSESSLKKKLSKIVNELKMK